MLISGPLDFYKMHGAGNDFIMLAASPGFILPHSAQIQKICNRHTGIGADGLIVLSPEDEMGFSMRYFNADGGESTMCGNGGRCAAYFARVQGWCGEEVTFHAVDGSHQAMILQENHPLAEVRLRMKDVPDITDAGEYYLLDTGSPHYVRLGDPPNGLDMKKLGASVRYSPPFSKEGINVNVAGWKDNILHVRTYERGVEDETLSCGTGVTASVLAAASRDTDLISPVCVHTPGGKLSVSFTRKNHGFTDVWLQGPAAFVFHGNIDISLL